MGWETEVLQVTSWIQTEQRLCVSGAEAAATPESHHYLSTLHAFLTPSLSTSSNNPSCWHLLCSSSTRLCVRYATSNVWFHFSKVGIISEQLC